MTRIQPVNTETASGKTKELLEMVQKKMGMIPNMMKTLAHAPAALEAYLTLSGVLSSGLIDGKNRERIALAVGQKNNCDYCVSAHSLIGQKMGLSAEEVINARKGFSTDSKADAIVKYALALVEKNGHLTDAEVAAIKASGLSDAEMIEIVPIVALNIFTNYFNHIADPEIDFPIAQSI